MSLKMVPKKVQQATPGKKKKTSKDWDSTNQNLSQMTLSPSERRLKKDVQARYSKVHRSRPSSTVSTPTSASKNTKTVSWEDWKLKPEVDFEQELAHALPGLGMSPNLAVVASPRVRVSKSTTASAVSSPKAGPLPSKAALRRKPPVVNKNSQSLKWDAVSGAESNCLHSALEQLALNDGLGTIMEGMTHLNHVLCLQNGDINDESELEMHRWSDWSSQKMKQWIKKGENTLANLTKFVAETREKIQTTETQLEASQEYNRSLEKKIDKLLKSYNTMQESNKSLSGRLHDLASDQKLSKAVLDNHTLLLSECLDSKAIVQNISLVMEGTLHLQESGKHVL